MPSYDFSKSIDLDSYCSKGTIAAAVTKKLREGATLEECTVVAKEVIVKNNRGRVGKAITDIKGHMRWMEKRNARFEINGNRYKIIEDNSNKSYESKKAVNLTSVEYRPTKNDCEKAIKQLRNETASNKFYVNDVLIKLKVILEKDGKILHKNWKKITIMNLKIWFD